VRSLAIDTATAACSVALIEDGRLVAREHAAVGRGHAERLVPMIASLPGGGRADRILVDCGPGSFTGIRVGIAAARGLALGWGVTAHGYSSTTILAARALADRPGAPVVVAMEGGHGELFVQGFAPDLTPLGDLASLTPEAAIAMIAGRWTVGSGVAWLGGVAGAEALPDAADAVLLPAGAADLAPRPIYGRAPDAKLPQPRPVPA
jgi:tRNA threonylcarbamoyl adenosine modification protein YeaZ